MPVARTHSIALVGVQGFTVEIESDIENGLPALLLVGLPDTALREARDRIRAAIVNSHEQWPQRRITVGLSPASLPKRGSGFDLGIALSILAAAGAVPWAAVDGVAFLGELGLDGRLRPVRGVLPAMAAASSAGFGRAVVADANAAEAALVPGLRVAGAPTLAALLAWLRGEQQAAEAGVLCLSEEDPPGQAPVAPGGPCGARPDGAGRAAAAAGTVSSGQAGDAGELLGAGRVAGAGRAAAGATGAVGGRPPQPPSDPRRPAGILGTPMRPGTPARPRPDLAELLGQPTARRAAEICAAGGHHLSLLGPPGAGKTMLAERIPTVMPALDRVAAMEVTSIHSVTGTLPAGSPLMT